MNAAQMCLFAVSAICLGIATRIYIWVRSKTEADVRYAKAEGFEAKEAERYARNRRDKQLVWTRHILKLVGCATLGGMFYFDQNILRMVLVMLATLASSVVVTSLITVTYFSYLLRGVPRFASNPTDQVELNTLHSQAERVLRLWCVFGIVSGITGAVLLYAAYGR